MEETAYRQSRLCRLLGNPLAFTIVQALAEHEELSPSAVAKTVGRSVSRVSHVLAALRLAEAVRYESDGRRARYRLKHPREVQRILRALADTNGLMIFDPPRFSRMGVFSRIDNSTI